MDPVLDSSLTRFFFESLHEPLLVLDAHGALVQTNDAANETSLPDLFRARSPETMDLLGTLALARRATLELREERGDAARIWALDGTRLDEWFVIIARDISAARDQREELAQLRAAGPLKLVAESVLHDFNDLLTPMLMISARLAEHSEESSKTALMAAELHGIAQQAATLVRSLVHFARHQPASIQRIDVRQTLVDILPLAKLLLRGHSHDVEIDIAPGLGAVVDRRRFEHAVLALLVNARETAPGGGSLTIAGRLHTNCGSHSTATLTVPSGGAPADTLVSVRQFAKDSGGRLVATSSGDTHALSLVLPHVPERVGP